MAERFKMIESMIKNLSSTQLEELFKILYENKCEYTINNNGVFFNLARLEQDVFDKIEKFVNYCMESKKELDKYESFCRELNENLDVKKEEPRVEPSSEEISDVELEKTTIEVAKRIAPRMSSSMKFYLLKKKFSKTCQINFISNMRFRELYKESPILKKMTLSV